MTADEPVAGVPRLCARRADCTRPRGHDDECGPDRADTELADLRAEVERHRLAVNDVLMACMDLEWATDGSERSMVNQVREVVRRWREAEGVARTNAAWVQQQHAAAKEAREQRDEAIAEVERLRYEAMLRGTIEGIVRSSALSATEAGQILRDVASLRDASAEKRRAEKAEAERGALQRQVHGVRAVVDEVWNDAERQRSRRDEPLGAAYLHRATALTGAVKRLRAVLDAVEPADQPHPTPEAGCGHPNHGAPDHDCAPFAPEADECSTCGGSLDSPPCSLNRELGISGHTGGGGGCQKAGS